MTGAAGWGRPFVLEGDGLRLVPLDVEDGDWFFALNTMPGVRRYLWDDRTASRDETDAILRANPGLFAERAVGLWRVDRAGEPAGYVGIALIGEARSEELIWVSDPRVWRQGIAGTACRAVLAYLFGTLGWARVETGIDAPNRPSLELARTLGFTVTARTVRDGREEVRMRLERSQSAR